VKHDWYETVSAVMRADVFLTFYVFQFNVFSYYNQGNESLVITLFVSQLDPWGIWIVYHEDEVIVTFKTGYVLIKGKLRW